MATSYEQFEPQQKFFGLNKNGIMYKWKMIEQLGKIVNTENIF